MKLSNSLSWLSNLKQKFSKNRCVLKYDGNSLYSCKRATSNLAFCTLILKNIIIIAICDFYKQDVQHPHTNHSSLLVL